MPDDTSLRPPQTVNVPRRTEPFCVVMLPKNVNSLDAKVEDFERVEVDAENSLQAQMSDAVVAKLEEGRYVVCTTKPTILSEPEIHARRKQFEGPPVDLTKI